MRLPGLVSYVAAPGGGTTDYAVEMFIHAVRFASYTCFLSADTRLDMMYMPDAIAAMMQLMEAAPERLHHRNAYNVTAMSVTPAEIAEAIREHIPGFTVDYEIDPGAPGDRRQLAAGARRQCRARRLGLCPALRSCRHDAGHAGAPARPSSPPRAAARTGRGSRCPPSKLTPLLEAKLDELAGSGRLKGAESVTRAVVPPAGGKGPRFLIEGCGDTPFLRMNSNSYLGLSFDTRVSAAEEEAVRRYGTGPGAVRFISGTWAPHVALEARLARFHGREAAMLFSSAYATVMGTLPPLITDKTAVISDALNHSCIINAIALARPAEKRIYRPPRPRRAGAAARGRGEDLHPGHRRHRRRLLHARRSCPARSSIMQLAAAFDSHFAENVIVVADDSHGVGAFGATGRGTEEVTACDGVDLLVGTLGKAFGVNGGYVVAQPDHHRLPARDLALLHLLEPHHAGRGRGRARRRRPRRQRAGTRGG